MTKLTKMSVLFSFCCSLFVATTLLAQDAAKEPAVKKGDPLKLKEKEEPTIAKTASGLELKTNTDKASYGIGTNIGSSIKRDGLEINIAAMVEGIKDAIKGSKSTLTDEDLQKAFVAFRVEMRAKQEAKQLADAKEQATKGTKFLEDNKKRKGVTVTKSGLQYEVLKSGKGGATPGIKDSVTTHYHGTMIDGTVFDSSVQRKRPATFPVGGVIAGWTEVLQLMQEGDKWRIVLPADIAYGKRGTRGIPGDSVLIFEIELIKVNKAQQPMQKIQPVDPNIKKEG